MAHTAARNTLINRLVGQLRESTEVQLSHDQMVQLVTKLRKQRLKELTDLEGLDDKTLQLAIEGLTEEDAGDHGAEPVNYPYVPLPPDQFSFDAPLPQPVRVARLDATRSRLCQAGRPDDLRQNCNVVVVPGSEACHNLSLDYCCVLQNLKSGTSEDGMHGRNDHLLNVICAVGGLAMQRNKTHTSSIYDTRLDCVLYQSGFPALVLMEEKQGGVSLDEVDNDIRTKFVFTPHYPRDLEFVIGISVSGDFIKFFKWSRKGFLGAPVMHNLAEPRGALGALRAAVNVGRLCRYLAENNLLEPMTRPFYRPIQGHRSIVTVHYTHITKEYTKLNPLEQQTLLDFYNQVKSPFLERQVREHVLTGKTKLLKVFLGPVGLAGRMPRNILEVKAFLRCVLRTLKDCNAKGWALNDLRWQNIVFIGDLWVVTDCEFAQRLGENYPPQLGLRCPWSPSCETYTDLWAVGKMLGQLGDVLLDEDLKHIQKRFTSTTDCFQAKLSAASFLAENPAYEVTPGKAEKGFKSTTLLPQQLAAQLLQTVNQAGDDDDDQDDTHHEEADGQQKRGLQSSNTEEASNAKKQRSGSAERGP